MQLKDEKEIKSALAETRNVEEPRKLEILAHAQSAEKRGVLDELYRTFLLPAKEGGLNTNETAFAKKLVDGEPSALVLPPAPEIVSAVPDAPPASTNGTALLQ